MKIIFLKNVLIKIFSYDILSLVSANGKVIKVKYKILTVLNSLYFNEYSENQAINII